MAEPFIERFTLPKTITGSTWRNVAGSLWANASRGVDRADGAAAPVWTNEEVIAVVVALRAVARQTKSGFALWYQFAALAYGWDPQLDRKESDLDNSPKQARALCTHDVIVSLGEEIDRVMKELDDAKVPGPRLDIDSDTFSSPEVQRDVMEALQGDGTEPQFKIPLPVCKGKDGKPAKPIRGPDGKWKCPDGVIVVSPGAALWNEILRYAIPAALILVIAGSGKNTRRRRKG